MRGYWILLLAAIALLAGCGKAEVAGAGEDAGKAYKPLVKQFGQAVMRGDWQAAYAMTTPEFQAKTSQAQMQADYGKLVAEIQKEEPNYKPNMVDAHRGDLPKDEQEAAQWGISPVPPKSTWKAWACAEIGEGQGGEMDRGIDAWMLVTEQGGQTKLSHVEFMFPD